MPALRQKLSKVDDYPAFLDACWQEHLAPRADDAPTVVSTFAGAGGSSLGYSMAGFRELLAVEWDDNAVATFRLNFPDVPVYHGDIAKLSVEDVLQRTGLQPGQLDVFDGSPPCQGFSTAGERDFYDDRNQLFREYVRLLHGLQPKVVVMENVSGMVKGKMKLVFADILRGLKANGYRVSARLLSAMYFNVPQNRQRMIFVGIREDLGIEPSHPAAVSVPITVRAAWRNLAQKESDLQPARLKENWQMTRVLEGKEAHKHFGLVRLSWDKSSNTIQKDAGNTTTGIIHPSENRRLTIPEVKRVTSFPDSFVMTGAYKEQWARIGNSVPPLFMRSIALHVRREILAQLPTLVAA
jgi:DNA (cytosine-5)-methyltransferase 1